MTWDKGALGQSLVLQVYLELLKNLLFSHVFSWDSSHVNCWRKHMNVLELFPPPQKKEHSQNNLKIWNLLNQVFVKINSDWMIGGDQLMEHHCLALCHLFYTDMFLHWILLGHVSVSEGFKTGNIFCFLCPVLWHERKHLLECIRIHLNNSLFFTVSFFFNSHLHINLVWSEQQKFSQPGNNMEFQGAKVLAHLSHKSAAGRISGKFSPLHQRELTKEVVNWHFIWWNMRHNLIYSLWAR